MAQKNWNTERVWGKYHKVLTDNDCNWQVVGDEVEIIVNTESGIQYGFFIPLENFPYEFRCFAENFDELEYASEISMYYDEHDLNMEDLIVEGNEIKDILLWIATDLETVEQEGA